MDEADYEHPVIVQGCFLATASLRPDALVGSHKQRIRAPSATKPAATFISLRIQIRPRSWLRDTRKSDVIGQRTKLYSLVCCATWTGDCHDPNDCQIIPVVVDSSAPAAGTSAFLMNFHVACMKPVWTKQLTSITAASSPSQWARGT
jgi:hypothetical protein